MRLYEGVLFLDSTFNEALLDSVLKDSEHMIEQRGGKLLGLNRLGKRTLGFPVRKQKEGHTVIIDFELPENQLGDLDRAFRLS
jgi:ribosomal protein S6